MFHYKNDYNHNNSKTSIKYKLPKNSRKFYVLQKFGKKTEINITSFIFQYHWNNCKIYIEKWSFASWNPRERIFLFSLRFLILSLIEFNPLNANPTKWSNIQTIRRQKPRNCLSVFDHFAGLAFKELTKVHLFRYIQGYLLRFSSMSAMSPFHSP